MQSSRSLDGPRALGGLSGGESKWTPGRAHTLDFFGGMGFCSDIVALPAGDSEMDFANNPPKFGLIRSATRQNRSRLYKATIGNVGRLSALAEHDYAWNIRH